MNWPAMDFFMIGAQKCATSWLYLCLSEHPDLSLPAKKDEANYLGGTRHRERGPGWHEGLYSRKPSARLRGSVSVDYLYDRPALESVIGQYPGARFVVCLRQPMERAASAARFLARRGQIANEDFAVLVDRGLGAWSTGAAGGEDYELIARGMYSRQLEPFVRMQRLGDVLVLGYEWLCEQPREALRATYGFLGVNPDHCPPSLSARPKWNANLPWLVRLERLGGRSRAWGKVMDHANRWACRLRLGRPYQPWSADLERRLRTAFAPDVAQLEIQLKGLPVAQRRFRSGPRHDWGFAA